jgi:DNA-binding IclR family transcriptional regulator
MPISPSPAVLRAGDLLEHLARHPSDAFSVSELARLVGVPRATCDSILQALAEHDLVVRRAGDLRYELGAACVAIGDAARAANSVLRASAIETEHLARTMTCAAAVTVRVGDEARVAEVFDFGPPFGIRAAIGEAIPLVPPFGAIFVAWDEEDRAAWLARAAHGRDRWRRALDAVRARGYSLSVATPRRPEFASILETLASRPDAPDAQRARDELIGEMQHSEYLATDIDESASIRLTQMSAPVFDGSGRVAAAIMLLGPEYDLTAAELHALGEHVVRAAERATSTAGGTFDVQRTAHR